MGAVSIKIVADAARAIHEIDRVRGSVVALDKSSGKSSSRVSRFGGAVKTVGKAAALASVPIAGALVYGITKSVQAASEAEQAHLRLTHAVERAGGSQKEAGKILDDLQRKQFKVAVSDEELADGYSKIVTSTGNVALSQKGLNAALDVAAARNISLNTASLAVGKALAGQTTSLQRLGIHLDANASKTEVLAALQERFGGAAVKQASGAAGALKRVGLALDELEETAGRAFLPLIKQLGDWLSKTENQKKAQEALKTVIADVGAVAKTLGSIIQFVAKNWDRAVLIWKLTNLQLVVTIRVVQKLISVFPTLRNIAVSAAHKVRSAWDAVQPIIDALRGILNRVGDVFNSTKKTGQRAGSAIQTAWDAIKPVINAVKTAINAIKGAFNTAKKAGDKAASGISAAFDGAASWFDGAFGAISDVIDKLRSAYDTATSIINLGGSGPSESAKKQGKQYGGRYTAGATGGIVTRPTWALIGEAGPEAVVPLNRTPGSRPLPAGAAGGGVSIGSFNVYTQLQDPNAVLRHAGWQLKRLMP